MLTIFEIFSLFDRNINIFAFHTKPSLKFSVDLVNFLIFSPPTEVLPLFLPTDVLVVTFKCFSEKNMKTYLPYYTISLDFWGRYQIFEKFLRFFEFSNEFSYLRGLIWCFFSNINIFNYHAWEARKFSADLVGFLGKISHLWKISSIFRGFKWIFIPKGEIYLMFIFQNINIFNYHVWQYLKFSVDLVDYKHIYISC